MSTSSTGRCSGRRGSIAVLGSLAALALSLSACGGAPSASSAKAATPSEVPAKPSKPVTLNILDIAGDLQLTQGMIDNFVKANPDVVKSVTYTTAPAPDMAGKLQAEQQGGHVSTSLVLSGTDGLAAGVSKKLLTPLTPTFTDRLPNMANYLPAAANMQELAQGQGAAVVYYPSGPLMEYNPKTVKTPPKTPEELLAYAKAHPGKVQYAAPANSGPGRTFLMGLPYLLGDSDPKDPTNGWSKTWAYLKELGQYAADYASGTTETMKNLADGTVDIVLSTTGWDINPRALGTVPADMQVAAFDNMHWVADAQYALVPKGVSPDVEAADLALINWMLQPDQQALAYDTGYFYPGPAIKDVPITMAPQTSQDVIAKYGRPEYDKLIADNPIETPLPADKLVAAFDQWNRQIGSAK